MRSMSAICFCTAALRRITSYLEWDGKSPAGAGFEQEYSSEQRYLEILQVNVEKNIYRDFIVHPLHFIFAFRQSLISSVYSMAAAIRLTITAAER
jgi:hypothetical protein